MYAASDRRDGEQDPFHSGALSSTRVRLNCSTFWWRRTHTHTDACEPLEGIRLGVELGLLGHRLDQFLEAGVRRNPSGDNVPPTLARQIPANPRHSYSVGERALPHPRGSASGQRKRGPRVGPDAVDARHCVEPMPPGILAPCRGAKRDLRELREDVIKECCCSGWQPDAALTFSPRLGPQSWHRLPTPSSQHCAP